MKTPAVPARLIENVRSANGYLMCQVVRTESNGSKYRLVGIDCRDDEPIGSRIFIHPRSGGSVSRAEVSG